MHNSWDGVMCPNCGYAAPPRPNPQGYHDLKCWPPFFQDTIDGRKTFEYRKDDRHFEIGDTLTLHEFEPARCVGYTGRTAQFTITYKLKGVFGSWGIPADYCILGIALK
jgi:hypothetical protein